MKALIIYLLLFCVIAHGQDYTYYRPVPYKNHQQLGTYNQPHPIGTYLQKVTIESPSPNKNTAGFLYIVFKFDKNYSTYETEIISFVDPFYDSLILKTMQGLTKELFDKLEPEKLYGLSIPIGRKKNLELIWAGLIFFADGKTKKAESIYQKLLKNSPRNSEVLFYLGRSMIDNGKGSGMEYILEAKNMGDYEAYQYLENN